MSQYRMDSTSSLSTHDCTIESVDIPSPIVLNNSLSDQKRDAFTHQTSLGSDSVFSSTEEYNMDRQLLSKLESIQEKSLHEMDNDDLEEGIGISFNRRSKSVLERQSSSFSDSNIIPVTNDNLAEQKRKAFSRMKSISYDDEALSKLLHEQLNRNNNQEKTTPIIVKTEHVDEHQDHDKVLPQQVEGLLQVLIAIVIITPNNYSYLCFYCSGKVYSCCTVSISATEVASIVV